jgi:hypothetical protein
VAPAVAEPGEHQSIHTGYLAQWPPAVPIERLAVPNKGRNCESILKGVRVLIGNRDNDF